MQTCSAISQPPTHPPNAMYAANHAPCKWPTQRKSFYNCNLSEQISSEWISYARKLHYFAIFAIVPMSRRQFQLNSMPTCIRVWLEQATGSAGWSRDKLVGWIRLPKCCSMLKHCTMGFAIMLFSSASSTACASYLTEAVCYDTQCIHTHRVVVTAVIAFKWQLQQQNTPTMHAAQRA